MKEADGERYWIKAKGIIEKSDKETSIYSRSNIENKYPAVDNTFLKRIFYTRWTLRSLRIRRFAKISTLYRDW